MYCKRCHIKMKEEKRSFHKQRKWVCPKCGSVRFERPNRKEDPQDRMRRERPDSP